MSPRARSLRVLGLAAMCLLASPSLASAFHEDRFVDEPDGLVLHEGWAFASGSANKNVDLVSASLSFVNGNGCPAVSTGFGSLSTHPGKYQFRVAFANCGNGRKSWEPKFTSTVHGAVYELLAPHQPYHYGGSVNEAHYTW